MEYKDLHFVLTNIQATVGNQETRGQKKLVKIFERLKPVIDEYNEKSNELRLDNASVDEQGILLLNEKGGYKYGKEGLKNLTKQLQDLDNQEVAFEPITVVNPGGLEVYPFLKGWVTGVEFITSVEEEEEL